MARKKTEQEKSQAKIFEEQNWQKTCEYFMREIPVAFLPADFKTLSNLLKMAYGRADYLIACWEAMKLNRRFYGRISLKTLSANFQSIAYEVAKYFIKEPKEKRTEWYYIVLNSTSKGQYQTSPYWNKLLPEEQDLLLSKEKDKQ